MALVARSFNIVVVNPCAPIKSIADLIAAAKAEPRVPLVNDTLACSTASFESFVQVTQPGGAAIFAPTISQLIGRISVNSGAALPRVSY